jgi:hypothetical protein
VNRAQMRHDALEQDWNRLRDYEREWRVFGERIGRVLVLIVTVAAVVAFLVGCDSQLQKCARWSALAEGYTMCIKDPACTMEHHHYVRLNEAKRLAIEYCAVVS